MSTAANISQQADLAAMNALRELLAPLKNTAHLEPACVVVQPNEIPHPADALLVHHQHMTEVLERHYDRPVDVHVLDETLADEIYTRKISLSVGDGVGCASAHRGAKGGGDGVLKHTLQARLVVEYGIARLNFRYMSPQVRDEILAKQTPLGAILIRHNVHRRIKPRWFMRFPAPGPVLTFFGDKSDRPMFGRIGTIYCNEEPAIELLEIVTGEKKEIEPQMNADERR